MPIERVEVIPYALPFREPYVTARGRLDRRELVLFRLTTDDGVVGLGETTSLSLRGGRTLPEVTAELERVGARLVDGAPADSLVLSPEARCACAIALLDIELRTGAAPERIDPIPCNATLSAGSPDEVADSALRWADLGFRSFKLKVGPDDDLRAVAATREALGSDAAIRVDANGTWTPDVAARAIGRLAELETELCEQPLGTLAEMAGLRRESAVPLAADESVRRPEDGRRAAELRACDMVTLKLAKVGGPDVVERGEWALPAYLSSALDGPVGIAAAGRVAGRLRARGGGADAGVAHGLATQLLFSETIAAVGPEVRDGELHLPDGPGLGVEIDEEALVRYRI
jgi:muconate cycloisomerase